jgi:outer membrane protein TolC
MLQWIFWPLILAWQVWASVLNFSSYEEQVLAKNTMLQGLKNNIDNYQKKQQEENLLFSPFVFANFYYSDDESEKLNPQFMGVTTTVKNYELGLKQQTSLGQQLSLSYQAQYIGMNGTILSSPVAYEVGPKLELTQSLWRNFFGEENRAQQKMIKAQNAFTYYQELYQYQQLIRQAKLLYVNAYIAKEALRLQQEALRRAVEILSWAKKRSQRQLADESDFLQAQAQVLSKEYEVKTAKENFSKVSKQFQTFRGSEEGDIEESLQPLPSDELLSYKPSAEFSPKADFVAFQEQIELSKNQSILSAEKYKPTFELFGQMQYQGRDAEYGRADDEAWDKKNEWWVVGVRFMAPLYFFDAADTISAYEVQEQSAEAQLKQKEMESLSDWKNLKEQLEQNKEKLKISKKLLSVQKKKIEVERSRLKQGRTTTYQVLMFEIDYLNAELMNLRAVADLLQVTTELDLYKKM